jgi:hypothetical protein
MNANLDISKTREGRAQSFSSWRLAASKPVLPESSSPVERVVAGGFRYPSANTYGFTSAPTKASASREYEVNQ